MHANAVRLAHYPQDPYVYELADRLGLLLWSEIPFVNRAGDSPATPGRNGPSTGPICTGCC